MKSWKLIPKIASVSKYVECYWFLEKEPHDQSHSFPKLNPDPSCHLIITNDNQAYHYANEGLAQIVEGHHWIFPHLKTFTMDHSSPFKIIGVKFKTGAPYSFNLNDL